jgi:hypothetical protein
MEELSKMLVLLRAMYKYKYEYYNFCNKDFLTN